MLLYPVSPSTSLITYARFTCRQCYQCFEIDSAIATRYVSPSVCSLSLSHCSATSLTKISYQISFGTHNTKLTHRFFTYHFDVVFTSPAIDPTSCRRCIRCLDVLAHWLCVRTVLCHPCCNRTSTTALLCWVGRRPYRSIASVPMLAVHNFPLIRPLQSALLGANPPYSLLCSSYQLCQEA